MRSIPSLLMLALMALAVAGCKPEGPTQIDETGDQTTKSAEQMPGTVPPAAGGSPELATAPCPAHLIGYCRGWEVYEANPILRPDPDNPEEIPGHINFGDKVVIGTASKSPDPDLWLFARTPEPRGRWGQDKIKLYEIESTNEHECLAGKIRLTNHTSEKPHEWHTITLRLEPIPNSEIGYENILEMCFRLEETNGSPPTSCEITGCAHEDDELLHGGVAHAQD